MSPWKLNWPWAVTRASATVPQIGGDIVVGNFGDGKINVYSPDGRFVRTLHDTHVKPVSIPGLWDLQFPRGALNHQTGPHSILRAIALHLRYGHDSDP